MKRLYKKANDNIWIPFLSEEENLKLNPNVTIPQSKEIKTFQDALDNNFFIKDKIKSYICEHFEGFNKYIHESNKDDHSLLSSIIHIITHFNTLNKIDERINDPDYKQLDKTVRLNGLKEYIETNLQDTIKKLFIQNKSIKKEISTPEMVAKLYDSLGSTTQLANQFDVDVDNRSYCFVYINGELLCSSFGGKHFELINEYLKKHSINGYVDADRYILNYLIIHLLLGDM